MKPSPGRYSKYLRLINISIHILIINLSILYFDKSIIENTLHILYVNFSWLIIAYITNFYQTYRFTDFTKLMARLVVQFSIFSLANFSYYALTQQQLNINTHSKIAAIVFLGLLASLIFFYFSLKIYRRHGGNFRRVVIIGNSKNDKKLKEFFISRSEFGYQFLGFFSDKTLKNKYYIGTVEQAFSFISNNLVDEIYCSLEELTKDQLRKFINFSEEHYKTLKFTPKSDNFFINEAQVEYYDYIPIVTLRKNPLAKPLESLVKRMFDLLFSTLIILAVLSWLTPLLWILIKIESKGPLFFKQVREGLNGHQFYCYKFRSMHQNDFEALKQTEKNDSRITKIGKFIRKTSIDELPQFINVFLGQMSVVGPRPHMLSQGEKFKSVVNKYAVRYFVKPGITGLAQIKGFRGEIETISDIQNRVKFDLFYIENWSFFLDIKIIFQTIFNALKGEKNAY